MNAVRKQFPVTRGVSQKPFHIGLRYAAFYVTLALFVFHSGCVSGSYTRVYKVYPPKTESEAKNIAILTEKPTMPFSVIADFQFTGASENYVRNWAAKHGADAVLVSVSSRVSMTSSSFSTVGPDPVREKISLGSNQQVFCTAIKFEN